MVGFQDRRGKLDQSWIMKRSPSSIIGSESRSKVKALDFNSFFVLVVLRSMFFQITFARSSRCDMKMRYVMYDYCVDGKYNETCVAA